MDEPSAQQVERPRLRRVRALVRSLFPFAAGVIAALVAVLIYSAITPKPQQLTKQDVKDSIAQAMASATPMPAYSALVFQVIQPSLVVIQVQEPDKDGKPGRGLGSGVIVNDQGDILTSLHVIADATSIKLTFADGTESSALVMLKQPENDIAVVRAITPPKEIVPAVLGNPNAMHVGDEVYAVGHPYGLYDSMTAGVISGFGRSFQSPTTKQTLKNLIQIDTAVNPGNSGGPLLNRSGEVIGIVAALLNPTDQDVFIGIGFAVPIDVAGGGLGMPPY